MANNAKYFFDGKNKECGGCFIVKPLSDFHKTENFKPNIEPKQSFYRTHCRPCRSTMAMNWQSEQRVKKRPWAYWECDECDKVNSISKSRCFKCKANKPKEYN